MVYRMHLHVKKYSFICTLLAVMVAFLIMPSHSAYAKGNLTLAKSASAGVGGVLDPYGNTRGIATGEEKRQIAKETDSSSEDTADKRASDLVMANVNVAMNVRTEPSEDADRAGFLYKDCGGRVIERRNGWTKLQSGDLVGWAKDDYLLFGEEAKSLAAEVGVRLVSSSQSALAIRETPETDGAVVGIVTTSGVVDMIEDLGDGWISVDYDDRTCYVQSEYVDIDFRIDTGETMEVIEKRAEEEKARKAKLLAAQGILAVDSDETRLLAALIQCEAGNQPYEGKVAVGAVVMNRVHSGAYANTIYSVIYASGQFTPARNGMLAKRFNGTISDSCMQAAREAMAGATTVGSATHFRRVGAHEGGIVIGAHVFW